MAYVIFRSNFYLSVTRATLKTKLEACPRYCCEKKPMANAMGSIQEPDSSENLTTEGQACHCCNAESQQRERAVAQGWD